jgi:hypothetical protein
MNGVVVVVSADTEWSVMQEFLPDAEFHDSPMGEWFKHDLPIGGRMSQPLSSMVVGGRSLQPPWPNTSSTDGHPDCW